MFAILITNTWTKAVSIFPEPFYCKEDADKKLVHLKEKCSDTNGIKNNGFKVLPVGTVW